MDFTVGKDGVVEEGKDDGVEEEDNEEDEEDELGKGVEDKDGDERFGALAREGLLGLAPAGLTCGLVPGAVILRQRL